MASVIWRQEALDELDAIIVYIKGFDPSAAVRTGGRLIALGQSLVDFPRRGRPMGNGLRKLTSVPPYIIRYHVVDEAVHILSVRHGARLLD
jgi:plasmid stabilization system protein ParE